MLRSSQSSVSDWVDVGLAWYRSKEPLMYATEDNGDDAEDKDERDNDDIVNICSMLTTPTRMESKPSLSDPLH